MKSAVGRLLVWVLAALLADSAGAQSPTPSNNQSQFNTAGFSPQVGIVFVVLIVAVFALGYCSIYLRHCYGSPGSAANFQATPGRTWRGTRGLGKDVIDGFPTFSYSEVKDHKIGKGALECAVCLNEFEDADTLRLLPKCDHVFHPECIGAWLEHHITCPVCRSDLSKAVEEVPPVAGESMENDTGHMQGEVVVEVNEIQIADIDTKSPRRETSTDFPRSSTIGKSEAFDLANFRSHTTGHSLVLPGENLDRFTLKLPHGVRKEVMERCMLNRTRSTAAGTSTFNSDGGRGGGATFIQRFQRSMKSDRQAIFTRTASLFSPKVSTDGSNAGGGRSTTRMSTLNCLEPKAADDHEAELIPNDASQLSSRAGLWAGLEPARPNNA